jgi:hypothetical protein
MLVLGALWVFTSYFIGTYSTGDVLALRARNEVVAVATVVFAISIVSVVQAVAGAVLQFQKREMPRTAMVLALLLAAYGTSLIRAIREAPTYSLLNEEWPQLAQYWRESSARNDLLSTTQETDVVVPRRTVTPRLLIGDELKETTPYQLPNDCIARFYGKKTVLLAHQ